MHVWIRSALLLISQLGVMHLRKCDLAQCSFNDQPHSFAFISSFYTLFLPPSSRPSPFSVFFSSLRTGASMKKRLHLVSRLFLLFVHPSQLPFESHAPKKIVQFLPPFLPLLLFRCSPPPTSATICTPCNRYSTSVTLMHGVFLLTPLLLPFFPSFDAP